LWQSRPCLGDRVGPNTRTGLGGRGQAGADDKRDARRGGGLESAPAGFEPRPLANSISVLTWAASSGIEGLASAIVIWRFTGARTMSEDSERRAQRWVAGSFFLLAPYFLYEAIHRLIVGADVEAHALGLADSAQLQPLQAGAGHGQRHLHLDPPPRLQGRHRVRHEPGGPCRRRDHDADLQPAAEAQEARARGGLRRARGARACRALRPELPVERADWATDWATSVERARRRWRAPPRTPKPPALRGSRERARQDLNLRPLAPEASALSTELRARVRPA
jgi:hypothetical protein